MTTTTQAPNRSHIEDAIEAPCDCCHRSQEVLLLDCGHLKLDRSGDARYLPLLGRETDCPACAALAEASALDEPCACGHAICEHAVAEDRNWYEPDEWRALDDRQKYGGCLRCACAEQHFGEAA